MTLPPADERFSATAEHYRAHRPGYPPELVPRVCEALGVERGARVVDLGCGTGIATRLFAGAGFDVTGVEPNPDMLAHARAAGGPARYVQGRAEATGLAAASFDLAIAAQAFHWFALGDTLAELRRVLRRAAKTPPPAEPDLAQRGPALPTEGAAGGGSAAGGHERDLAQRGPAFPRERAQRATEGDGGCAAFWNLRGKTPLLEEYERLLRSASAEYERVPKPLPTIAAIEAAPGVVDARRFQLVNRQVLDRDGLRGRAFSSSYVAHGVADRPAFTVALDALFDRHQVGGVVELLYDTVVLTWRLAPPA